MLPIKIRCIGNRNYHKKMTEIPESVTKGTENDCISIFIQKSIL